MNTKLIKQNLSAAGSLTGKVAPISLALGLMITASILPSFARNFCQNHPRRAEVLRRDNNINREINRERGDLGGHYGQLKSEDRAIRKQEQRDARMNGGHITAAEQQQLNREENRLNNQIRRDDRH